MSFDLVAGRVMFPIVPSGQVTLYRVGDNVVIERRLYRGWFDAPMPDEVSRITCPPDALRAVLRLFDE